MHEGVAVVSGRFSGLDCFDALELNRAVWNIGGFGSLGKDRTGEKGVGA